MSAGEGSGDAELPTIDTYGSGRDEAEIREAIEAAAVPIVMHPAIDHANPALHGYRVFVNPSTSEVLCTATAEVRAALATTPSRRRAPICAARSPRRHRRWGGSPELPVTEPFPIASRLTVSARTPPCVLQALAMGKKVLIPRHPSNLFFEQFSNVLMYEERSELAALLREALATPPLPMSPKEQCVAPLRLWRPHPKGHASLAPPQRMGALRAPREELPPPQVVPHRYLLCWEADCC